MCINLANEQLQLFFNTAIFEAEQVEYEKEGVTMPLPAIFADNRGVLDLFFRKPLGLLSLLDEESSFQQGLTVFIRVWACDMRFIQFQPPFFVSYLLATNQSLAVKLGKNSVDSNIFRVLPGSAAFEIKHYAGNTVYQVRFYLISSFFFLFSTSAYSPALFGFLSFWFFSTVGRLSGKKPGSSNGPNYHIAVKQPKLARGTADARRLG